MCYGIGSFVLLLCVDNSILLGDVFILYDILSMLELCVVIEMECVGLVV